MTYVVDTSVVLALSFGEDGAERAEEVLKGALISSVNLTEIVAGWIGEGATDEDVRLNLADFNFDVRDFDVGQAITAGRLSRIKLRNGFSLGDRACVALALKEGRPVATADRVWATVDLGTPVELIR